MPDAESTDLTKRKVFISSFFIHKYVPRQCSLRRKAPKNEPCASWISRTERRLRRIVTTSPASSSATACPSALIKVAGGALMALMRMPDDSGKIMERFESECGEIGFRQKPSAVGKTIGPPAASEYAVEPVGELTMSPSQRERGIGSPSTLASRAMSRETAPRPTTMSLSAVSRMERP